MNIVLFGFMATGKTTIGKILAEKLNYGFIDTDQLIEEDNGKKITKIFEEHGEDYFRKLEKKAVKKAAKLDKQIIACGGGAVLDPRSVEHLKKNGNLVLLKASVDEIIKRTRDDTSRPLLQGDDPKSKARVLLEKRSNVYDKVADIMIDTTGRDPEKIAKEILFRLEIAQ